MPPLGEGLTETQLLLHASWASRWARDYPTAVGRITASEMLEAYAKRMTPGLARDRVEERAADFLRALLGPRPPNGPPPLHLLQTEWARQDAESTEKSHAEWQRLHKRRNQQLETRRLRVRVGSTHEPSLE